MRNNVPTAAVDRLTTSLAVLATFGARKIDESRYAIDDLFGIVPDLLQSLNLAEAHRNLRVVFGWNR